MSKDQKVAVVTGGAHGIGLCITEEFRKAGVRVFVIDKAEGDHYVGDISKQEVLEEFARYVIQEAGHVAYLINNAAPLMKGIEDCTYDEFQYAIAVGVTAPFYLSKLFLPYFREGASIINISSSRDRMSQPQTESYTAAKGGISALTHAMAVSLGRRSGSTPSRPDGSTRHIRCMKGRTRISSRPAEWVIRWISRMRCFSCALRKPASSPERISASMAA